MRYFESIAIPIAKSQSIAISIAKFQKYCNTLQYYWNHSWNGKSPQNNLERNIDNTKDEELYIDCRFIFGSAARAERLFSHCKYIKTETRNRLTPQLFEAINFLKSNRELWENSQQLISRAISMSKMENILVHIKG